MTTIKTTITILVVILLTLNIVSAQTTPVKHLVVKGDNIYRLSLRYGVSMESIFQLNPGSRALIKTGEIILIPKKEQSTSTINNTTPANTNSTKVENYVVSKGETKYGLSKKFNISIKALEDANPSIIKMLIAGQTIQIPSQSTEAKTPVITDANITTHTVKKGENLWMISQQYNMTLSELTALNKNKLSGYLQIGQILAIQNDTNTDNDDDDTYIVVKGDTKSSLSRRFNISISKLEQLNPEIVPMLKYGTRINTGMSKIEEEEKEVVVETEIEEVEKVEEIEEPETKDTVITKVDSLKFNPKNDFIDYTIKPKETLYGLAKQAHMSIEEFLQLNPSLKESVTEGSVIKMPTHIIASDVELSSSTDESVNNTSATVENKSFDVSVVWDDSNTSATAEFKKQKSGYYLGLQKAIDSISKLHPKSELQIRNSLSNPIDSKDSLDTDTPIIALYPIEPFKQNVNSSSEIDMMSLRYSYQDSTHEFIIRGLTNEDDMRKSVLTYLKEQDAHVICIYDENHAQHKTLIENSLPEANLIATNENGTFQSNKLKSALKSDIKNFVIIESDKVGVFLSSTNTLLKEMSNAEIQLVVLNPKNIPPDGAVASKRFKILKLLYPQQYNSEISKGLSKATALGFAFNYDLLERLFKNGLETFNNNTTTSVFGFSFNYVLNDGVYENKSVILFVFDENSSGTQIYKK